MKRVLYPVSIIMMLLPWGSSGLASELGDAATALQPGHWVELPTNLASLSDCKDAWADSASWDPANGRVNWLCSGASSPPHHHFQYDVATNQWTRDREVFTGPGHSYDHNTANNTGSIFYTVWSSGIVHEGTVNGGGYSWTNLPKVNIDRYGANSLSWVGFLDGDNGALMYVAGGGRTSWYKQNTGWTALEKPSDQGLSNWSGSNHTSSQYSPVKRILWVGKGSRSFTLNDQLQWSQKNDAQCSLDAHTSQKVYDPASGNFLVFCESGDKWWEFDPEGNGDFVDIDSAMVNKPSLLGGTNSRVAVTLPEYNVIMVIAMNKGQVWLYRHAPLTLPPTDTVAPSPPEGLAVD